MEKDQIIEYLKFGVNKTAEVGSNTWNTIKESETTESIKKFYNTSTTKISESAVQINNDPRTQLLKENVKDKAQRLSSFAKEEYEVIKNSEGTKIIGENLNYGYEKTKEGINHVVEKVGENENVQYVGEKVKEGVINVKQKLEQNESYNKLAEFVSTSLKKIGDAIKPPVQQNEQNDEIQIKLDEEEIEQNNEIIEEKQENNIIQNEEQQEEKKDDQNCDSFIEEI